MNITFIGKSVQTYVVLTNIAGFGTTNALTKGMTVPTNKKNKNK
jgi:hypothetical protein